MRTFFEWFSATQNPENPWLLLGKGPSYARLADFDTAGYRTISLNHVVRERPVTVSHMIDYDVLDATGPVVEKNAEVLVMPWIPHQKNCPGKETLEDLARVHPILKRLNEQNRLLYYNLSSA